MVLEHYISDLLYRYNCVVVPGFGAFLTQKNSAQINAVTNTFSAPNKSIVFNRQLISNDGLLVSYVSNAEKVSYETALVEIENQVKTWQEVLVKETSLHLKNIGSLTRNQEDKILFQPANETNYLTSSFGLSNFNSIPVTREVLKVEVEEIEEKIKSFLEQQIQTDCPVFLLLIFLIVPALRIHRKICFLGSTCLCV